MILLIDNYDSFVYNLARYVRELGETPVVRRHDAVSVAEEKSVTEEGESYSTSRGCPMPPFVSVLKMMRSRSPVMTFETRGLNV